MTKLLITRYNDHQTGYPTTQDKVYRLGEWVRVGRIITQYKQETMKVERVYVV